MVVSEDVYFFNDTATTEICTLSLHDALPISGLLACAPDVHLDLGFGHFVPPCPVHLARSLVLAAQAPERAARRFVLHLRTDRKSTRLNSSHANISYAVFCLKQSRWRHARRALYGGF